MKKTKILCTIGPASYDPKVIKKMLKAGMNAARINTAYGTLEECENLVEKIRKAGDIPILFDVKGPEIRLNLKHEFHAKTGETVKVGFNKRDFVSFNRDIYDQLRLGDEILLDKGKVKSSISSKSGGYVTLKLENDCRFRQALGVNIPKKNLKIPTLSRMDRQFIGLGKKLEIDYIALSFTRDVDDVSSLKRSLRDSGIGIISKIENQQGIDNIEEIIKEGDGVMIARGDLGIEIPFEEIPWIQKEIIDRCNRLGKISIVATEMMHSMIEHKVPTRAETSDVANAVLDGADAVMLSAETAAGKYPVEAVKAMNDISEEVECHLSIKPLDEEYHDKVSLAISRAVKSIIQTVEVDKIVVATHTGYSAMLISNFRLCKDIIAITDNLSCRRKLHLVYAVRPIRHRYREKGKILDIARYCYEEGLVRKNDLVLFAAGLYTDKIKTNNIQLHKISDLLGYLKKKGS